MHIAQAYLHLAPYQPDERQLRQLGDEALKIAVETAREVYGGDVEVELLLEEGSAKFWATVSVAAVIYGGIADWKSFKGQVTEWIDEAKQYAQSVNTKVIQVAGAEPRQVLRQERRVKTPGKLRRFIDELERLNEASRTMPDAQIVKQMEEIVAAELAEIAQGANRRRNEASAPSASTRKLASGERAGSAAATD